MQAVQTRNESLLLRFLPDGIVQRLRRSGMDDAEWEVVETSPNVSVVLGRLSGYEAIMQQLAPEEVVETLDSIVQGVDAATERFGVEKVRTFGDSYLAVCGLSTPHLDHARRALEFAQEMRATIRRFQVESGSGLQIKCLVASGPAIAGIIGRDKLTFDVYGEPVSQVQWLEQQCPPDEVYVSQAVYETLSESYEFEAVVPPSSVLQSDSAARAHSAEPAESAGSKGGATGATATAEAPTSGVWRLRSSQS